jgi:hypothetical protein
MEVSGQLRWRRVVRFAPQALYSCKNSPLPILCKPESITTLRRRKNPFLLLGIKAQFLVCLVRSHHSTDLRYLGSLLKTSKVLSSVATCTFTGVLKCLIKLYLRFLITYLCKNAINKVSLKRVIYFQQI